MKPVLFHIGPAPIFTYGFTLACALTLALIGIHWLSNKRGMPAHLASDALFWSFAGGLIGGRLYYVFFHLDYYFSHPLEIIYLHQGGLTWYGALLGALLTLWVYSKVMRVHMIELTDLFAPFMALSQSIGRIGCFFNGCCEGLLISEPGEFSRRIPIQLYESTAMFLAAAILLILFFQIKRMGIITCGYLFLQGVIRFVSEFYRADQPVVGTLTHAQIISLVLTALSVMMIIKIMFKDYAKRN